MHIRTPAPAPVIAAAPLIEDWVPCARWSEGQTRLSWPCAGAAIGLSAALLMALVTANVISVPALKRSPTVVSLIEMAPEPPETAPPPKAEVVPLAEVKPVVVAPKAIVQTPVVSQPIQTIAEPPPVAVAVVAPPAEKPAPAGPVSVTDLSTSLLSGQPPKYPVASRRLKEEGTVVIALVVSTSGRVGEATVYRSSGHDRLDKAALDAVRRFVYKPYMVDGAPVMVRTTVTIPFKFRA